MRAFPRPDVVNGEDVGMVQCCYSPRFLLKAPQSLSVGSERHRENLDSDIAPQSRVASAIYLSHPARAQRRKDFIRTEFRARSEGHPWAPLYS
jgi:hypothetical protein